MTQENLGTTLPEENNNNTQNNNPKDGSKKNKKAIIALATAGILLIGGTTAKLGYQHWHNGQIWDNYNNSYTTYTKTQETTLNLATKNEGIAISCREEVTEDNYPACDALNEALEAIKPEKKLTKLTQKTDVSKLEKETTTLNKANKKLTKLKETLDKAIKKVEEARLAKAQTDYNNANTTLGNKIDELTALIAETEGKVADNQVRVDAQTAADTAKAVKEKMVKESVSTFREATNENNESTADVQAHIDALTNARDTYQQQQSQAAANTNTGNGKATTRGGNSNRAVSGNNGYVAPRGNGGRTSGGYSGGYTAPSGGGTGSAGGSTSSNAGSGITDWDAYWAAINKEIEERNKNAGEMPCQAVGTCQ